MDAIWAENSSQQQMCKRHFFQWAIKWFYATASEDVQEKPDVALLAKFFQSIGFRLQTFEKSDNDGSRVGNDNVKVTIECSNSGMKACLQLGNVKCQCPNLKDTEDASLWSVDSGPMNTSTVMSSKNIEACGSNLLAPVPENTAKVINDVVYHLFKMIGEKNVPDVNQNTKSRSNLNLSRLGKSEDTEIHVDETFRRESQNFGRSRTQPEIIINTAHLSICRKPLNNQATTYGWGQTIDMDEDVKSNHPRSSPLKIVKPSDFKFNQLCSSLESISLLNEQNTTNLAAHVLQAHKSIEKALEIIGANKSPINEQTFLKPNVRGSTNSIVGDSTKKESSNSNVSLKISPNRTFSRSMQSRKYTGINPAKDNLTTEGSKLSMNRRSISSTRPAGGTHPNGAGCKNSQPNVLPTSKIPGNRKSFHALGSTKLASVSGKNNDSLTHKDATPKDRFASGVFQSTIPKMSPSLNQSSSIPTQKVKPLKQPGQKETKETSRRSVGNPRFGYGNKKA